MWEQLDSAGRKRGCRPVILFFFGRGIIWLRAIRFGSRCPVVGFGMIERGLKEGRSGRRKDRVVGEREGRDGVRGWREGWLLGFKNNFF